MLDARHFSRTFEEVVLCSRKPPNAFERMLGVVKGQAVTLYHNQGLTPWMSPAEVLKIHGHQMRREYRGPVEVKKGFDYRCPYCSNALVYECLNCGLLWCCPAEEMEHRCDCCNAAGPVHVTPGPPLAPEPYEPPGLRARIWAAWLDFNEWVYDLMTRKARPEAIHEAAETFRKRRNP